MRLKRDKLWGVSYFTNWIFSQFLNTILIERSIETVNPSCFVPPANRFKRSIRPNQIYLFQSNSFIFTNSFSRALWSPSGELRRRFDQFNHKMIRFHLYGSMYHVSATVIYSQRRAWVILITGHLTKYLNLAVDLFYRAVNSIFRRSERIARFLSCRETPLTIRYPSKNWIEHTFTRIGLCDQRKY